MQKQLLTVDVRPPLSVPTLPQSPAPYITTSSPHLQSIFITALNSPGSFLASPISDAYHEIRGETDADTRRIIHIQRDLRESELRLQQAGRLGMELHQQNDRLRRGIEILQNEYDNVINEQVNMNRLNTDATSTSPLSSASDGLKAMKAIRSQNTLLQARNQSLNAHCEEADTRIEELVVQVHDLERQLRRERTKRADDLANAARVLREKERETRSRSRSNSSVTSSPKSIHTPRSPLRLEYASTSTSTTQSTATPCINMSLAERVDSFLHSQSSVGTATTPSLHNNINNNAKTQAQKDSLRGTETVNAMQQIVSMQQKERLTAETINDMRADVLSMQQQLDIAQEELNCERSLRDKLDNEVQTYHEASKRYAEEASILNQEMRLVESARHTAETKARKLEAQLRNITLEEVDHKARVAHDIATDYQRKLVVLEGGRLAAEDRAMVFQQQAIDLLQKLGMLNRMEENRSKENERSVVRVVTPISAPPDYGYSLKLKMLKKMYEKAGRSSFLNE